MDIVDNALSVKRVKELYEYFINRDWTFNHNSPTIRYQNMVLRKYGRDPIDVYPIANPPVSIAWDLWSIFEKQYPGYKLVHELTTVNFYPEKFGHIPHYDFFNDQYVGNEDTLKRIIFYCVPEWKSEWGGSTYFYGLWKDNKNEPGDMQECQVKPGRLVKFGWDEMHSGSNWDSSSHKRVILSAYLSKDCPEEILDKIHFYIWGNKKRKSTDLAGW